MKQNPERWRILSSFEKKMVWGSILFALGSFLFHVPPSKIPHFFRDAPFSSQFSEEHAQRREVHLLTQRLEKEAFFERNTQKIRAVALVLAQQERFQDAAHILVEAVKWEPQDEELKLDAAKMLLLGTEGVLVPKIQSLLRSIPETSSCYKEAQKLLSH